jgi:hypothetical protein
MRPLMAKQFTAAIAEELAEEAFLNVVHDMLIEDDFYDGFQTSYARLEESWTEALTARGITVTETRLQLIGKRFESKLSKYEAKLSKDYSVRLKRFNARYANNK